MSRSLTSRVRRIVPRSVFEALCVRVGLCCTALLAPVHAAPTSGPIYIAAPDLGEVDVVGEIGADGLPQKAQQDTVWIADWSFDSGSGCTSAGWVVWDNRILNVHNDAEYWHVDNRFAGQGGVIANRAAILSKHDLCWAQDGYGNDNDFSIILKYSGASATLKFDKASDSEPGFDFVRIECDSLGLSESRANPSQNPAAKSPAAYRVSLFSTEGFDPGSTVGPVPLRDFGPGVHEVYIRFVSDGAFSDEDGDYPTALEAGLVVDNIAVTGGIAYTETFEGALNPNVTLIETSNAQSFLSAPWLRVFPHISDNDKCTENTTCAWLGTDPTRPAFSPRMAFGPSGAVIRNWLDDIAASPWVSLASTPTATGTFLSFRLFDGNSFGDGAIVQQWRVRSRVRVDNTDTPAPGDSVDCMTPWGYVMQFQHLANFRWTTVLFDMTPFVPPTAAEVQVSFRTVDWQYLTGSGTPAVLNTGPGPFWDRVRIGRRVLTGPTIIESIDSRTQAQDAFPTVVNPSITPGQHHVPDGSNRFGSCAFSLGQDLGINTSGSTRHISGDSITLEQVVDARGAGGIASVRFFGAITSGPHDGKVPGPYTTTGGFFVVNADSTRSSSSGTVIANRWHVDLNDDYFRGGDALKYFWAATDNSGGFTSTPVGLTALPTSVAHAEAVTGGLHEVNFLPTILWAAGYVTAVVADPEGDVAPTAAQIAASIQKNCILYYQKLNSRRRSGMLNRTSFMYTLDHLGYQNEYDVYDVQGYGNTANQLITRANVGQVSGYSLIIQDDGRSNLVPNIPAGQDNDGNQFDQAGWYRSYLAQGSTGLAGSATLWLIGENTAFLHRTYPLITTDFGLSLGAADNDQGLGVNPLVRGHASSTFSNGSIVNFSGDEFALNGGCPVVRAYDTADPTAGATQTHRYAVGATNGRGAIIMNRNAALQWNTVWMGFGWFDIRFSGAPTNPTPQSRLATQILSATIGAACNRAGGATDTGDDESIDVPPARTELHANVPNPFNPTTRIAFDLATAGFVRLQVFDAAGRLVRTLVQEERTFGRYVETWTGIDEQGGRVSSGVYFYRLEAPDYQSTRKMVLLQ